MRLRLEYNVRREMRPKTQTGGEKAKRAAPGDWLRGTGKGRHNLTGVLWNGFRESGRPFQRAGAIMAWLSPRCGLALPGPARCSVFRRRMSRDRRLKGQAESCSH